MKVCLYNPIRSQQIGNFLLFGRVMPEFNIEQFNWKGPKYENESNRRKKG